MSDFDLSLIQEARTELQRGWRLFKAFEHADKAMALAENAAQVVQESQQAAAKARAEKETAVAEVEVMRGQVLAARDEASATLASAKDAAAVILDEARAQAKAMRAEGDAARAKALEEAADLNDRRAAVRSEINALQAALAESKDIIEQANRIKAAMKG